MKIKIFLLFIVGILYAANTYAELKHFLPRSNAVMSILDKKYWFEGDTIIENKRYTKVYQQRCYYSENDCSDQEYYAAVREDTIAGKIYGIRVDDGVERLLADFDVKAGDEVTVYSFFKPHGEMPIEHLVRIENVDSVLIDNQYRKRVNMVKNWSVQLSDSWVEGFGSIVFGLFFSQTQGAPDAADPPVFLCLHIDDVLIYQNPKYDTCYMHDSGVSITETKYLDFKVYPTLVDNNLYIEKTNGSYYYKIYNSMGMPVRSKFLENKYIDVSMLNQGVYYIVFYDANIRLHISKFIKR
ncbi:hypothetical protein FACS189437_08160 [Bacteroidia bacterium]|nr:hypothetical protein FACS189437_08160 [Bacteroidia bacterium]